MQRTLEDSDAYCDIDSSQKKIIPISDKIAKQRSRPSELVEAERIESVSFDLYLEGSCPADVRVLAYACEGGCFRTDLLTRRYSRPHSTNNPKILSIEM